MHLEYLDERINRVEGGKVISEVYRTGDFVIRRSPNILNEAWRSRFLLLLDYINLPAFVALSESGYITWYIDGIDLWGARPFLHQTACSSPKLTDSQREEVLDLFKSMLKAGKATGWYLADFTRRNLILSKDHIYMIDYEVIVSEEEVITRGYLNLWQQVLNYLGIECKTNSIEELLECLK